MSNFVMKNVTSLCFMKISRATPQENSCIQSQRYEDHERGEPLIWAVVMNKIMISSSLIQYISIRIHLLSELWDGQGTVLLGTTGSKWCEASHEEMKTWERNPT